MKVGDFVRLKKNGRIGIIAESLTNGKFLVEVNNKEETVMKKDIEIIKPLHLTENDLRNIFRMNVSFIDLFKDYELSFNYSYDEPYLPTVDDLLALLMNMKIKEITCGGFLDTLYVINYILKPCYLTQGDTSKNILDRELLKTKADLFEDIFDWFDVNDYPYDELIVDNFCLDDAITTVSLFKKNMDKPLVEREYAEVTQENYILCVQDSDLIDTLEAPYSDLFVKFVNELAEKGNHDGLEALAYCCYGGNKLFACDWEKSRQIFEKLYNLQGKPYLANSLGYIYYYGRTNNGVADYDKAFKCFSIGAAAGLYESKYKMADMFRTGKGVVRQKQIAEDIYGELYEENLEIFSKGFFDCKLADIALRMGDVYAEKNNIPSAYYFYLQADFAIRKRMEYFNDYGDQSVFDSIQGAIENCKRKERFDMQKYVTSNNLEIVKILIGDGYRVQAKCKKQKNNKIKINFKRLGNGEFTPACLLSILSFNGCLLTDEFSIVAKDVYYEELPDTFVFNHIETNDDLITEFYFYDEKVACIEAEEFRFNNPIKEYPTGEYRIITVKTDETNDDYVCDNIFVSLGDSVYVTVDGKDVKGTVTRVVIRKAEQLPKPIEQYTKILGRDAN